MIKTLLLTLVTVALLASPTWAQDTLQDRGTVEVVAAGQVQSLDVDKQSRIKFWLQQLMLSTLSQDLVTESTVSEWDELLTTETRIYCRYPSRATLAIPEHRVVVFDEVLLPWHPANTLHWIFVKRDREVLRLVFWDPWVYAQLVAEAGIPGHERWSIVERHVW